MEQKLTDYDRDIIAEIIFGTFREKALIASASEDDFDDAPIQEFAMAAADAIVARLNA